MQMAKSRKRRLPVGRIKHAYTHSVSVQKIADRYGCNYMSVRLILIAEGLLKKKNRPGVKTN
jgi:hypothetical protein